MVTRQQRSNIDRISNSIEHLWLCTAARLGLIAYMRHLPRLFPTSDWCEWSEQAQLNDSEASFDEAKLC